MIDEQGAVLAELTRELVERFAPERIVLFGSRARGDHHPESDYDVMMVLGESNHSEIAVRLAVQQIRSDVEIFVGTREKFERRRADVGTLEYVADREGRILYTRIAAPDARQVCETPNERRESLREWTERARADFTVMTTLVQSNASGIRDGIVFHAHEAVEKMLKAALVPRHVQPPRTHELTRLMASLPSELRDDSALAEACQGLQALWPKSRYPHESMPTSQEVDQAVVWARRVREIVSATIAV